MKLNVITVDDEPLALELLTAYCQKTPQLHLIGTFDNTIDALRILRERQDIHLIFLDINMPDLGGVDMAAILNKGDGSAWPRVIFVSAHKEYALQAFDVNALYYITKPYNYTDFLKAVKQAESYAGLVSPVANEKENDIDEFMIVRVEHRLHKIVFRHIVYIESIKDYVKFHMQDEANTIMCIDSLKRLEGIMPSNFMRIHRSHIVNLDKITALNKQAVFFGRLELPVSEQYRESFHTFMTDWTD